METKTAAELVALVVKEIRSIPNTTTRPYRTQDARVAGVVITFADISERKTAERAIEAARSYSDRRPELDPFRH